MIRKITKNLMEWSACGSAVVHLVQYFKTYQHAHIVKVHFFLIKDKRSHTIHFTYYKNIGYDLKITPYPYIYIYIYD
jgi:hypothetical protein